MEDPFPDRSPRFRNDDVDWDRWPVGDYLSENYRRLHRADASVIDHHSAFYAQFPADSIARSVELGAGPNLYPLMLAAAACRRIEAVERSAANVAYLRSQLDDGPDETWLPFYTRCRRHNPALPPTAAQALARVHVVRSDARSVPPDTYDLASMNFVAESITENGPEFAEVCRAFVRSVRPGGHLVAAFMENMGRYQLGDGSHWPGYPVDEARIRQVFAPHLATIAVTRIDADPALPDYGYSGMVLLAGRRR
ncbi:MAG: class I SAM-dependent methyltransferase [Dactylosporangium sp.]|nr:class I SAM-dependent methyltransferase [Dactylosporangium sp.]NNJ61011.1 class I SAM-dependent methyltransferase [Dactylosporangium sp.]